MFVTGISYASSLQKDWVLLFSLYLILLLLLARGSRRASPRGRLPLSHIKLCYLTVQ